MNRNHIIIINACSTYGRMLLSAALGLFSSRWILAGLGQVDFGLFSVVGGVIGFLAFINSCMAGSAQRHFAYAIGGGDLEEVRRWFNTSLSVHLCLAMLILVLGIPVGGYMLKHVLSIPAERLTTCFWVFYCALFSTFFNIASVPFIGMFSAKQRIMELAVFAIGASLLNFGLAYSLLAHHGDRLLWYSLGVTAICFLTLVIQLIRLFLVFPECSINWKYWWDGPRIKELVSFAGWTLFGTLGNLGRFEGMILLINQFFGAKMNSALGIANSLSGQVENISSGMFGALAPEITASEGRGERDRMISLALRASKFSVLLVMIILIPLLAELDYVLALWLKNVPVYAAPFARIILLTFFVDKFTAGYMVAVSANGKIAAYQATLGGVLLLTFPLAYVVLRFGGGPVVSVSCTFATGTACALGRVWWVKRLLGVPVSRWLHGVVFPCGVVAVPACVIAYLVSHSLPSSFPRFSLDMMLGASCVAVSAWFLGFDRQEKFFVSESMRRGWKVIFSRI